MNDLARLLLAQRGITPVDLLVAFTLLALLPLLAVSVTAFPRIVVVLGLLRASLGTPSMPPNTVVVALAMMLSLVVMAPTVANLNARAFQPYTAHRITLGAALERGADCLSDFMLRQARPADVAAFARMERTRLPESRRPPFAAVAPAFLVGELRAAFAMGFALALPFVAIDLVVAAVLMSLGMFMVSPNSIALPLKLLLFVVADGWSLVAGALVASYR